MTLYEGELIATAEIPNLDPLMVVAEKISVNLPEESKERIFAAVEVAKKLVMKLQLKETALSLESAERWERTVLLLGIAEQWQDADLNHKKKLLRQLSQLYGQDARERSLPYHHPEDSQETDNTGIYLLYVYCYFDELIELFPELSQDPDADFDDVLALVQSYSTPQKIKLGNQLNDWLFTHKAEEMVYKGKQVGIVHLPFNHRFGVSGANSILKKIHTRIKTPEEYQSFPLAFTLGVGEQKVVALKKHSQKMLKIHEFNHAVYPNLFMSLGDGLNEAVTEWLTRQEISGMSPRTAANIQLEEKIKQKFYFGNKYEQLMAEIYFGFVPNLSFTPLFGDTLAYNAEVSFLERRFAADPLFKELLLERYRSGTAESATALANYLVKCHGLQGYLDLNLMNYNSQRLNQANTNVVGYLSPQEVEAKVFGGDEG